MDLAADICFSMGPTSAYSSFQGFMEVAGSADYMSLASVPIDLFGRAVSNMRVHMRSIDA